VIVPFLRKNVRKEKDPWFAILASLIVSGYQPVSWPLILFPPDYFDLHSPQNYASTCLPRVGTEGVTYFAEEEKVGDGWLDY